MTVFDRHGLPHLDPPWEPPSCALRLEPYAAETGPKPPPDHSWLFELQRPEHVFRHLAALCVAVAGVACVTFAVLLAAVYAV